MKDKLSEELLLLPGPLGPYQHFWGKGRAFKRWINCSRDWTAFTCTRLRSKEETSADGCSNNLSNQYFVWVDGPLSQTLIRNSGNQIHGIYLPRCMPDLLPVFCHLDTMDRKFVSKFPVCTILSSNAYSNLHFRHITNYSLLVVAAGTGT